MFIIVKNILSFLTMKRDSFGITKKKILKVNLLIPVILLSLHLFELIKREPLGVFM